jgi:hypothetical protein
MGADSRYMRRLYWGMRQRGSGIAPGRCSFGVGFSSCRGLLGVKNSTKTPPPRSIRRNDPDHPANRGFLVRKKPCWVRCAEIFSGARALECTNFHLTEPWGCGKKWAHRAISPHTEKFIPLYSSRFSPAKDQRKGHSGFMKHTMCSKPTLDAAHVVINCRWFGHECPVTLV